MVELAAGLSQQRAQAATERILRHARFFAELNRKRTQSRVDARTGVEQVLDEDSPAAALPEKPGDFFLQQLRRQAARLEDERRARERRERVPARIREFLERTGDASLPGVAAREGAEEKTLGDRRVDMFFWVLQNVGVRWSSAQRLFHWWFLQSVLPHLYGDTFESEAMKVCERFKLERIDPFVCVMAPRRVGKTWCLAAFVAAFMLVCPGKNMSCFSATERSGKWLLDKVMEFLRALPGSHHRRIVKLTATELVIHTDELPEGETYHGSLARARQQERAKVTRIRILPSTVAGTRGHDSDVTILEEAGFVPNDVFMQSVAPVLGIARSSLCAITTPPSDGQEHFFMRLRKVTYRGRKVFRYIEVAVACKPCQAQGRAHKCTHRPAATPPWQTGDRKKMLLRVLGEKLWKQEAGGMNVGKGTIAFSTSSVYALETRGRVMLPRASVPVVYVTVDPAAGGEASEFAVVSMAVVRDSAVIVGMDTTTSDRNADYVRMLEAHMEALVSDPRLRGAFFVLTVEANLSKASAGMWVEAVMKNERFASRTWAYQLDKGTGSNPGYLTTNDRKLRGAELLRDRLEQATLHFAHDMVTTGEESAAQQQVKLCQQLRRVVYLEKEAPDAFGQSRFTVSGKAGRECDDAWMALQIGLHVTQMLRASETFRGLLRARGLDPTQTLFAEHQFRTI